MEYTMLQIRHSAERGAANHGWLNSHHSFSFGHYHDPKHMGFGPLLVINEDRVTPAQGFGTHGTATWKSFPMCWKARWNTRTAWAPVPSCTMAMCSA